MAPKPAHVPDALVKEHFSSIELNNPMGTMGRILKVTAIMRDTLLKRKANPQDDIISMLWQTRIDDKEMTLDTLEDYCVARFLAGLDTVMNAIGLAVRHLAPRRRPAAQASRRSKAHYRSI